MLSVAVKCGKSRDVIRPENENAPEYAIPRRKKVGGNILENQNVIRLSYIWMRAVVQNVPFQNGDVDQPCEYGIWQKSDSAVGGTILVEGVQAVEANACATVYALYAVSLEFPS